MMQPEPDYLHVDDVQKYITAYGWSPAFPVVLICRQTKGGDYSSDPTHYHFDSEREGTEYFTSRGHAEGLENWLAYERLCDAGYTVNVEMVER